MRAQLGFVHDPNWKPSSTYFISEDTCKKLTDRFGKQNKGLDVEEKICLLIDITKEADSLIENQDRFIENQKLIIERDKETIEDLKEENEVLQGESKEMSQKMVVLWLYSSVVSMFLLAYIIHNLLI